ncbi:hypothetical protein [Marinobacter sp.]|uniref:hypothetical protein n=1 Tax=Marinobacter sp. TaxID=50741 RepID=UPI003975B348
MFLFNGKGQADVTVVDLSETMLRKFANKAFHKIYNYPEHMQRLGLQVTEKKHFKLLNMNCYWSIQGQKQT